MKLNLRKGIFKGIWRDIEGYEGVYQVSNLGQVKNLNYNHTNKERIKKLSKDKDGYLFVGLYKNKRNSNYRVHRLVAQAFINNINKKPCVDHINTIKQDNHVWNLRWVTNKENTNNPITLKRIRERECTEETRQKIREINSGESNYWYGKHLSEEHKNKISKGGIGKHSGWEHPKSKGIYCEELQEARPSSKQWAKELGISSAGIVQCCNGNFKQFKGYHWRWLTEEEREEYKKKYIIDK